MAGYFELFSGWKPAPLACPTQYVRARDTLPGAEPAPDWSLPHAEVTVDGDHFTMLEEHARTTALAIHRWLGAGPVWGGPGRGAGADGLRPTHPRAAVLAPAAPAAGRGTAAGRAPFGPTATTDVGPRAQDLFLLRGRGRCFHKLRGDPAVNVLEQGPHRHAEDLGLVFADEGGVPEHLQDDHAVQVVRDSPRRRP
ncbi:hypothetical protein SMALB_1930 [Streptomyces malaysiensis]|uniref:Thioesterase TesA-like domain-containing protein n=1 Tax=Streptomyces malaysiensis TaxID=92644 RepID=A0A7X6AV54_STRMQ|nr:hypothetical protein [Streptomyces malaysiensis]